MKYVIGWKRKRHGTTAEYEAGQRRVQDLLRAWREPAGVIVHQWLARAGATGGYVVIETEDITAVHAATPAFAGLNFTIEPVLDAETGQAVP